MIINNIKDNGNSANKIHSNHYDTVIDNFKPY